VVGHGDGGHLLLLDHLHEVRDVTGAVKERVVGVAVQMDERGSRHGRFSVALEYGDLAGATDGEAA
jgi:hypothetical protein